MPRFAADAAAYRRELDRGPRALAACFKEDLT